jgi:hypothetical protein
MERYVFFDLQHVPLGLPVLGVPTSQGPVWLELTEAEYRVAVATLELSEQIATRVREVLAARFPTATAYARE